MTGRVGFGRVQKRLTRGQLSLTQTHTRADRLLNTATKVIGELWFTVGYSCWFPFLADEAYRPVSRNKMNLYELMFSPDVRPATLAIIGCVDTIGSVAVAAEMQCRYATRVFKVPSLLSFYRPTSATYGGVLFSPPFVCLFVCMFIGSLFLSRITEKRCGWIFIKCLEQV